MGQQTQQPLLLILETRGGGILKKNTSEYKMFKKTPMSYSGGLQLRSIGYSSASCLIFQDI